MNSYTQCFQNPFWKEFFSQEIPSDESLNQALELLEQVRDVQEDNRVIYYAGRLFPFALKQMYRECKAIWRRDIRPNPTIE